MVFKSKDKNGYPLETFLSPSVKLAESHGFKNKRCAKVEKYEITHCVFQDGKIRFRGNEFDCFVFILRNQSHSYHYATKYGGWKVSDKLPLRKVKVIYKNGDFIETSMGGKTHDLEIGHYYAKGKTFNVGLGPTDNIQKVREVIILEP